MLKKISKLRGVKTLKKEDQKNIKGGNFGNEICGLGGSCVMGHFGGVSTLVCFGGVEALVCENGVWVAGC